MAEHDAELARQIAALVEQNKALQKAFEDERDQARDERRSMRRDIAEIRSQLDIGRGKMWIVFVLVTALIGAIGAGIGRLLFGD